MKLADHKQLGPFGNHHPLATIGPNKMGQLILAIFTIITQVGSLQCKTCNMEHEITDAKTFIAHGLTHAGDLPPMACLPDLRKFFSTSAIFCCNCLMLMPSMASYVLHSFLKHHTPNLPIYCSLCVRFEKNTTLEQHMIDYHPMLKCPVCLIKLSIIDLMEHLLSPTPHYAFAIEEILPYFSNDLAAILIRAKNTTQWWVSSAIDIAQRLLPLKILNHYDFLSTAGFNKLMSTPYPVSFPSGTSLLITENKDFIETTDLIALLGLLESASVFRFHKEKLQLYYYELLQLQLSREISEMLLYSTPTSLGDFISYLPNSMVVDHLVGFISTTDPTSLINLPNNISFFIIGSNLLKNVGSHPSSLEYVVTLSTNVEMLYPTHWFDILPYNRGTGYISLTHFHNIWVTQDQSFLTYLYNIIGHLNEEKTIFMEVDVSSLLLKIPNHLLKATLKADLKQLLIGYFTGLLVLFEDLPNGKKIKRRCVLVNQLPFRLPALSIQENQQLHFQICNVNECLAAMFQINIVTSYSIVGSGLTSKSSMSTECGPTLGPDGRLSPKTIRELQQFLSHMNRKIVSFMNKAL